MAFCYRLLGTPRSTSTRTSRVVLKRANALKTKVARRLLTAGYVITPASAFADAAPLWFPRDSEGNQPRRLPSTWTLRGFCASAWPSMTIEGRPIDNVACASLRRRANQNYHPFGRNWFLSQSAGMIPADSNLCRRLWQNMVTAQLCRNDKQSRGIHSCHPSLNGCSDFHRSWRNFQPLMCRS